ncbi:MAG TPA: phosphoenolpyruvate kinase [Polyangiaceae bacterium]|nr:phosphoenolpyruvate kinase [Polyangiaceae bacterium]
MSIWDEAAGEMSALSEANQRFAASYPGDRAARQPVHTVYGGAQLYRAETTQRLGQAARRALATYAKDAEDFADAVALTAPASVDRAWLVNTVYERVAQKLEREAVEDFRIDFEDGFGARPDAEEDATAVRAAEELARAMASGIAPPFIGIRIKSLGEEWKRRAARTLELFLDTLLAKSDGVLPQNFLVTLPKITVIEQPRLLVKLLDVLERRHGLATGSLRLELMVETTQSLFTPSGGLALPELVRACEGRCVGAHLGTYDFTAACNVTAAQQSMLHPLCDLAKGIMVVSLAGTGVFLSDGATNVMPVGPHRGDALSPAELAQNRATVHAAWQLSYRSIRHSLEGAFYQGWDLHPAQLPVRYAACFSFFLEGLSAAAERLRNFLEKSAQATLVGDVFDDAATGQGLLNFFIRALNSGAIDLDDVAQTGLTVEEFGLRSFAKILAARRARLGNVRDT